MSTPDGPNQSASPPDPHDLTLEQAVKEAQRDYARLLYLHSPTWSVNLYGTVEWSCTCASPGPRNAESNDRHLLESIRKVRGPTRGPRKPK